MAEVKKCLLREHLRSPSIYQIPIEFCSVWLGEAELQSHMPAMEGIFSFVANKVHFRKCLAFFSGSVLFPGLKNMGL